MIWASRLIFKSFRQWERTTQIAFLLAAVLLVLAVILFLVAPPEYRLPVVIGGGLLLLVAQGAVLWGNRFMVSPFTQAQRLYLTGDLDGAGDLLESARARGTADVRTLTLLGATYRQLGRLSESEQVLYEALDKAPMHHFPLYNGGRTLLSAGRYEEALALLQRAVDAGAPAAVRFDVAEALILLGRSTEAADVLQLIRNTLTEPHRALMAAWWLYRLRGGEPPPPTLIREGLPYWEASAARFAQTSYGQAIAEDAAALLRLVED
ncbi:MAG: tetratricopeptide repeat protein [Anaerolineae bacterium]